MSRYHAVEQGRYHHVFVKPIDLQTVSGMQRQRLIFTPKSIPFPNRRSIRMGVSVTLRRKMLLFVQLISTMTFMVAGAQFAHGHNMPAFSAQRVEATLHLAHMYGEEGGQAEREVHCGSPALPLNAHCMDGREDVRGTFLLLSVTAMILGNWSAATPPPRD